MRWIAAVALIACGSSSEPPTAQAPPGTVLERAHPVEKPLASNEAHRYHVKLAANEVLLATVDQRGIDVIVSTFDPSGKQLAEIDSPNGNRGPEPVVIEAKRAGYYAFEVKRFVVPATQVGAPAPSGSSDGGYEARIDDIISADAYVERQLRARIDSPRILELWLAIRAKKPNAAKKFWDELKGHAPIVEPYPGDPESVLVTFTVRTDAPYAGMFGGPTAREKPMVRIADSSLWYLSARMPRDSRADYSFITAGEPPDFHVPWRKGDFGISRWTKKQLDTNNPKTDVDQSRLELPDAPALPWIAAKPENPAGKLTELTIDSAQLKEKRKIGLYTPPGYDPAATYPLVVAFDGEVYGLDPASALIPLPRILDNLIAAKKIPPVVAAIVANQGIRDRDLAANAPFAEFLAQELVPKLRADYHAGMTPDATVVTGSSLGGLCSVYVGLVHSDVFGNVLSQSGAFWVRPGDFESEIADSVDETRLFKRVVDSPKLPLRFYLDAGLFESDLRNDILSMNRRMRDVLRAKGYPVRYVEYSGGHDYLVWRGTIADGLIELLQR